MIIATALTISAIITMNVKNSNQPFAASSFLRTNSTLSFTLYFAYASGITRVYLSLILK